VQFKPIAPSGSIGECFKKSDTERMFVLRNKAPHYDERSGAYMLNFNGRVQKPSIKNFQLSMYDDPEQDVILQFGKVTDNIFHLDFKFPFSPFTALCSCLPMFDVKLME